MAEGLLVIRLVLGLLLIGHGTQKLFGWFGGHGLAGTGAFFESLGHRPGRLMAAIAGMSEAGGGLLLALGLLTPLGAAIVIGVMTVAAVSVHGPNGLWVTDGGYEYPLTIAVVAWGLGFTGAGAWSLDAALDIPHLHGWPGGVGAILLAVLPAGPVLVRQRQLVGTGTQAAAYPQETPAGDLATAELDERR